MNRAQTNGLFDALGTSRSLAITVCYSCAEAAQDATVGPIGGADRESVAASDLMIGWARTCTRPTFTCGRRSSRSARTVSSLSSSTRAASARPGRLDRKRPLDACMSATRSGQASPLLGHGSRLRHRQHRCAPKASRTLGRALPIRAPGWMSGRSDGVRRWGLSASD